VVFYLYSAIGVPRGIVRKEEVLDSWGVLIENGRGRAEEIFREAERFIAESKVPGVEAERREMAPGIIKGLLGEKRDFLVVKNKNLFRYQILIGARDYGSNLDVSWYLTYRLSFFDRLLSPFPAGQGGDQVLGRPRPLRAAGFNSLRDQLPPLPLESRREVNAKLEPGPI
jgi:hypothetical protein